MFETAGSDEFDGDAALGHIAAGLDGLRSEDRAGWSSAARSARVVEIGEIVEVLRAELVRAVAVWDGNGDYAADGSLNATVWLTHRIPTTRASAARLVATARVTRRSERIEKALAVGDVTVSHVETIARVIHKREDIFTTHGDVLIDAAIAVRPEEFRTAARRWRALADDEVGTVDDPHDPSRNELTLSPTLGGVALRGWFNTAMGLEIKALIDGYDHPDPIHGQTPPRTKAQRNAAALHALLFGERDPSTKNVDITLDATIDAQTLAGQWPTNLHTVRCDVDGYGPVPCSLIRSWLTEAVLRRVVTADSEVLDLGRGVRLASRAQRRAMKHRDGDCAVPDCARPPHWCDAHHVTAYATGGATNLNDLVYVCRRHHHMLEHGWTLTQDPDNTWTFTPPADPNPTRGPP